MHYDMLKIQDGVAIVEKLNLYTVLTAKVLKHPFPLEMVLLTSVCHYNNIWNLQTSHGHNILMLQYFSMKLCSYTNFRALFLTVDVDFCFFAYIKIFEIAKFVYCFTEEWLRQVSSNKLISKCSPDIDRLGRQFTPAEFNVSNGRLNINFKS